MAQEYGIEVLESDGFVFSDACWCGGVIVNCDTGGGFAKLYNGEPAVDGVYKGRCGRADAGMAPSQWPEPIFFDDGLYATLHGDAVELIAFVAPHVVAV